MTDNKKQIYQREEMTKTDIKRVIKIAEILRKLKDKPQALHMIKNKIENL